MKTLVTCIVFIIGMGLFFLVTGFNERPVLLKHQMEIRKQELHDTLDTGYNKWMSGFIPDITVQLVTGEYIRLPELVDQKKYIFITIWPGKKGMDRHDLGTIDSIAGVYKNKLMVIGLLDDGNLVQLTRLIKKYQLKNVKTTRSSDIKKYLNGNKYPYGILFSKTGKVIEMGMSSGTLAAYMEKHLSMSRAKF
jgi:hypothetical protein